MFIKFIRWLRGYVRFEIKGRFPERFMNICLKQGRFLFDTGPYNGRFYGALLLSDYKDIRTVARKSGVVLKITEKTGIPFVIRKYRSRFGLVCGAVFFIVISLFMQNFVWSIEINGIESLSEVHIRNILKENGLYRGAFKGKLNYHAIERDVMRQANEIGWMSINVSGTKVTAEIKEKAPVPYITPFDEPCNIKAETDGVILSMNIKQGSTRLTVGSGVIKGQLLVSGVMQNALMENSLVHADGEIIASTEHSLRECIAKNGVYKMPAEVVSRKNLEFLWLSIPITFSSVKEPYTSRFSCEELFLNKTNLKLGVTTEYCTAYEDVQYSLKDEEIKELLNVKDYLYRLFALKDCTEIKASVSVSQNPQKTVAYIKYNCIEDIVCKEKIIVN